MAYFLNISDIENHLYIPAMKTKLASKILFFSLLIIVACTKTSEDDTVVSGKITKHTGCKMFDQASATTDTSANQSCIEYNYTLTEEKVNLKHINAGFNCCPGELHCSVTLSNDTITIEESESHANCDCNCLFDLDIEVSGIEAGEYFVKFIEPYCGDQQKLEFSIDLSQSSNGIYCVERNQYPWGIFP